MFGVLSRSYIDPRLTMVTASQLQLLKSPITALIPSISTSFNVKLDDSNYLNWNFQLQLLLEKNGIMGMLMVCSFAHLNMIQTLMNLVLLLLLLLMSI